MALYVLGPDAWLLARSSDLLYLHVSVESGIRPVGLRFPSQHLLEHSWATDPGGVLRITQGTPGADGALGDHATALTEVADPSTARAVPMQSRLYGPVGGESDGYIGLLEPGGTSPGPAGELLEQFDGQWATGGLEFPTLLYLETYGRSRWRFSPAPRLPDVWSGVWSAELLETETALPGASGPLLRVARTVQHDTWVAADHWYGPPGFFFFPQSMYSSLLGAVFEGRVAMSMLGATGRLRGPHWPDGEPAGPHLAGFSYAAQDGREIVSVAVVRGHLSSGHAVELQTTTTREFAKARAMETGSAGPDAFARGQVYAAAYLTRSTTLTVREPVVASTAADSPFRTLRLADDALHQVDLPTDASAFWVTRGGVDARFAVVATDWVGNEIAFAMPLMFIADGADLADAGARVFDASGDDRRHAHLGGAAVALADRSGSDVAAEAITLPVHAVRWAWRSAGGRPEIAPATVQVALEAVGRLTDSAGLTTCTVRGSLDADGGFLQIPDTGKPVRLSADRAGGLAAPAIRLGAVRAGEGAVPTGSPQTVFGDARLLGVPLLSLLKDPAAPVTKAQAPTLRTERRSDAVVTTFRWTPELLTTGPVAGVALGESAALELLTEITQPLDLAHTDRAVRPATTLVRGTLTDAAVSVLGIIGVHIDRLTYVDEPGAPPRVRAEGVGVSFEGDLRFVSRFAEEVGGFEDGTPVRVTPEGITASYTAAVPPFGFGVFSLTNVTLGAALHIPFDGPAEVRFNFAERHAPFAVGVAIFGGGGFLAITATTEGLKRVEASLEFGGRFQIAIAGLVSGEVHALGGVALLWDGQVGLLSLEGYLRCGGHVSVLDVITLSVEFELALGYEHSDAGASRIHGRATVTVGVEVLWISESVSFTVERSFETGDGTARDDRALSAARFADERVWSQVCEAFA